MSMKPFKNKLAFPVLIAGGLLSTAYFAGCSSSSSGREDAGKEKKPDAIPEREAVPVQKGKLASSLQLPGELIAWQQVDIYAKENSFIKKLYADVGSEVKAGQLLATMEAPELTSRLAGAESRLKAQEALYTASKANYDRLYETSKTPGTISQNDLDQARARQSTDLAQLEAARAAYREVSDTRNYLEIRAPFNGVISVRNTHPGAYVGPAGKGSEFPIFTLQEQKKLRLVLAVPEAYTSYLKNKNQVSFTVKSMPSEKFKAGISRLSGALDSRLRSERIEMDVINNDKKLLPGMIAEVSIPMESRDSTFLLPKTAVVSSTEKTFVIRVNSGKAEWVDVKKGREANGKQEVFGDLHEGDHVLKIASDEIREGSTVNAKVAKS